MTNVLPFKEISSMGWFPWGPKHKWNLAARRHIYKQVAQRFIENIECCWDYWIVVIKYVEIDEAFVALSIQGWDLIKFSKLDLKP